MKVGEGQQHGGQQAAPPRILVKAALGVRLQQSGGDASTMASEKQSLPAIKRACKTTH